MIAPFEQERRENIARAEHLITKIHWLDGRSGAFENAMADPDFTGVLTPERRQVLEAARHVIRDMLAQAEGMYEREGGAPAHLECRFHERCERPGGGDCACLRGGLPV